MNSIRNTKFSIENKIVKGVEEPCLDKNKHNFGQALYNAISKHGNRISRINVETAEERSFNDVKDRSVRCALWLKKQRIGSNDIVAICSDNQLDTYMPAIATLYVGAVVNGWSHELSIDAYRYYLNLMRPKVIFVSEPVISLIQEAAICEKMSIKIIVFGKYHDFESLDDIMSQQSSDEVRKFKPENISNPLDPALIMFTSGSTGVPKAVVLCYDTLLENILSFCPSDCSKALYYSTMMWISGLFCTFYFLLTGTTVIMHGNSSGSEETLQIIEQYEVDWAFIHPYRMTECYKLNILSNYKLSSLRTILTGSAPINSEVYDSYKDRYPHVTVVFAYGISELGSLITYNLGEHKKIDSAGFIQPNRQLKVVDVTTTKSVGPNVEGELCLKSSGMMIGYYKNPVETKKAIDDEGWLHTGDLGYYDEHGEIFVTGRHKDLMRYRSHSVTPIELERLLLKHPEVMEVCVVPVHNDADGDRPMAFVKKLAGSQVTEDELIELSSAVGNGVKLWGGVKFVDGLPMTVSGKIARQKLVELAKLYIEVNNGYVIS